MSNYDKETDKSGLSVIAIIVGCIRIICLLFLIVSQFFAELIPSSMYSFVITIANNTFFQPFEIITIVLGISAKKKGDKTGHIVIIFGITILVIDIMLGMLTMFMGLKALLGCRGYV